MNFPKMLTLKEASKATGLSYEHLRRLCLENRVVHIMAGNKYLVNGERLIEYLEKGDKHEYEDSEGMSL